MRFRRGNPDRPAASPGDVFAGLRRMALDAVARGLSPLDQQDPEVCGLVVDIPRGGEYAAVVALADNTVSMYTSTGGGIIGAGGDRTAADSAQRLLAVVRDNLDLFHGDNDALPESEYVRLHVLTPSGRRCADVPDSAFWGRTLHPLTPVIRSVQELIGALRKMPPR